MRQREMGNEEALDTVIATERRCPLISRRLQKYVRREVDSEPIEGCVLAVGGPLALDEGGAFMSFDRHGRLIESDIQVEPTMTKEGVGHWLDHKAKSCTMSDWHDHRPSWVDVHLEGCTVDDVGKFLREYGY